jgi:hypothetical protein
MGLVRAPLKASDPAVFDIGETGRCRRRGGSSWGKNYLFSVSKLYLLKLVRN